MRASARACKHACVCVYAGGEGGHLLLNLLPQGTELLLDRERLVIGEAANTVGGKVRLGLGQIRVEGMERVLHSMCACPQYTRAPV